MIQGGKWGVMQGEMHHSRLVVPRLKVHKDWWQGLAEDFIDHDTYVVCLHISVDTAEYQNDLLSVTVALTMNPLW